MSNGTGTRKWVYVVGVLAAAGAIWLFFGGSGKSDTVQVGVLCTDCNFHGPADVNTGSVEWPVECPKCEKRAAHVAGLCPKCSKPYAADPALPPSSCPNCKAKLIDEEI